MNTLLLAFDGLAGFVTFGHSVFGLPWLLRPVRGAELALGPRTQLESIFHYVSVSL